MNTDTDVDNFCFNNMRYATWDRDAPIVRMFFNQQTVDIISRQVTQNLEGVLETGQPVLVLDQVIINVMDNIFQHSISKPRPFSVCLEDECTDMITQVIELITSDVRNQIEIDQANAKLTKWTTLLGDFNAHGLRSHSKICERRERDINDRGSVSFMTY